MNILEEVEKQMRVYDLSLFDETIPYYISGRLRLMSNRHQMRILNQYFAYRHATDDEELWLLDFHEDVIIPLARG